MHLRSLAILIFYAGSAAAQWSVVSGTLKQVAVAPDGTTVGITPNDLIYKWTGSQWQQLPGSLTQVSAGSAQQIWGVNAGQMIWKWNGSTWIQIPGKLKQVSAASDGSVWGTSADDSVYRFDAAANNWILLPGRLRVVAVGSAQEIWGVNSVNAIFRWNGSNWDQKPGQLATISVGNDKSVWGLAPNGTIYAWDPAQSAWALKEGTLAQISVANANTIWGVTAGNSIFQRSSGGINIISSTTTITPTLNSGTLGPIGSGTTPAVPTAQRAITYTAPESGKLVCTMNLSSETAVCGTRKAEYVGAYTLNMKCESGFFDPIYGGTCWTCPSDGDHGAYVRSTTDITGADACWRAPKEYFSSATKVSTTALAWECPSGSFWDPKGSCWTCPADTPRRTGLPVDASNACASATNQTKPATLAKFNSCPAPDPSKMKNEGKLAGKSMPGKPFLDIAGGWNQSSSNGGCYTCPTVDSDGNFLITMRNASPIYGENQGCTVYENYKPATFVEPGLTALGGVKGLLLEKNVLNANTLLIYLHALAIANGKTPDSKEARAWVSEQMSDMANSPYRNNSFRQLVLALLINALNTPAASRTASQQALVTSMGIHATNWRMHVAQQTLGMYDAWKAWDDLEKSKRKNSSIAMLFDYGTVPLDFQTIISALGAPTAVGVGMATSMGAASSFYSSIIWVNKMRQGGDALLTATNDLNTLLKTGNIIKAALGGSSGALAISAGATGIGIAGAVLTAVASAQFQAIITARPNLEAALASAKVPVTMDQIYTSGNGASQLQYLWIMAMDTANEVDDTQIIQLINTANQMAKANGYAAPI